MNYLFSSHDGYGLGHVRRNVLVATEILRNDPDAHVTLVTGVDRLPPWLDLPGLDVVRVPPLLKASDGSYRHSTLPLHEALDVRSAIFTRAVGERHRPSWPPATWRSRPTRPWPGSGSPR